jgi:glutamine phosphoribosylpyrophosphate amidotransferase
MCGIAGILYRDGGESQPVGAALMTLAGCLQHRGADSAGVAVFGPTRPDRALQVVLSPHATLPEPQTVLALGGGALAGLRPERDGFSVCRRAGAGAEMTDAALIAALEGALPGAVVTALGECLQIHKAVGRVAALAEEVAPLHGTHGIAHLRLATESRIDPAHAQPFWGRPFADIAVTHNGHITNYHKLRQRFEARGFTFASRNDSEIIGTYLGDKMSEGMTLREALAAAGGELDGSFSFIAATAAGLGVARDPFATKPLLFCEASGTVALASEPQALHRLLGEDITIGEIRPREVRVWEKD